MQLKGVIVHGSVAGTLRVPVRQSRQTHLNARQRHSECAYYFPDCERLLKGYVMLVLSRNVGEEIIIDKNVRVAIVKVSGNRVFLGIDAPKEYDVNRKEIWQRKKAKQKVEE